MRRSLPPSQEWVLLHLRDPASNEDRAYWVQQRSALAPDHGPWGVAGPDYLPASFLKGLLAEKKQSDW